MAATVSTDPAVFMSMDNAYLSDAIGKPLMQCLGELTEKMPTDPVEWIAHWLYKYADNELYMFEKAKYLELCAKIFKEIEQERKKREKNKALLAQKLMETMSDAAKNGVLMAELGALTRHMGQKFSLFGGVSGLGGGIGGMNFDISRKTSSSGRKSHDSPTAGRRKSQGRGKGGAGADKMYLDADGNEIKATWGINCKLGLVCQHPVLGDIEPRPPLIFPETPEWWEMQKYIPETLYDHEVYSRENDDPYPKWDKIKHLTYKDFVEPGPWLTQENLKNMQGSLQDMVRMPKKFKKHVRPEREGDYFPEGAKEQRAQALRDALDIADNNSGALQGHKSKE